MSLFDSLPNEILQLILSKVVLNNLKYNLVSKRFDENIKQICVIKLKHTISLDDIERLSEIYKVSVDLSYQKITDIDLHKLRNVHTLNLCGTKVVNVSALGNVHTLNLCKTKVVNVSALGNVHTLNLSYTNVSDVSALRHVHTLNLSYTKVTDVSALGNVPSRPTVGLDTSVRRLHTLSLSNCYKVKDVSALGNVHTLDLSGTKVSDVSLLKNVRELNLFGCYNVTNVSTLGNARKLILRDTNVINVG